MGEIADLMIEAEMMGMDPSDLSPEEWLELAEDSGPPSAEMIADEAAMTLSWIKMHGEGEISPAELLEALFPKLTPEDAQTVEKGLYILARQSEFFEG